MHIPGSHGVNSKKVETRGKFCRPGWCHMFLESAKEEADKVILTFVCVGSTTKDNIECKHIERLWFIPGDQDKAESTYEKALFFALAFGLITQQDIDSGSDLDVHWERAVGKQCIIHLEEDKKDARYTRIAYKGVFDFNDEEVLDKGIPLDMSLIQQAGIKLNPRRTAATSTTTSNAKTTEKSTIKNPVQSSAPAATATKPKADLGDI